MNTRKRQNVKNTINDKYTKHFNLIKRYKTQLVKIIQISLTPR